MATHSLNGKESLGAVPASSAEQREGLESELSQSLSELSSINSSTKGKKGKRRKHQSFQTLNYSKSEEMRPISRSSISSDKQYQSKAIPQPLRGTQVCARSCGDGLFYPGVVLKHINANQVLVQFADGETDRINVRLVVPRGGARPCPVLHPGDYVLVRVRSKYGQHPNLSTGLCDYFVPAILQMTPYKGDMTFPPSRAPVYAATSFNGRPVSSLRAGMVRISRPFFLSVCRYIQQLMVGLSASIEEDERHPALSESPEGELRPQRSPSPSTDTLSKLVEKQSEQHLELMERLSQVISLSSRASVGETGPPVSPPPDSEPYSQTEQETLELTPTEDANIELLSPSPLRPLSAPVHTQTAPSLPETVPYLLEQGVQATGMQDKWTESLPPTFSQGTSTQLDELRLSPVPDPRLESLESSQQSLLRELEGVSREVTALREAREAETQEPPNAYLVMQAGGQAVLVSGEGVTDPEGEQEELSLSKSDQGPTLLIQDLTPPADQLSAAVSFCRGESVLVDTRQDGWFYTAEVLSGSGGTHTVCMKVNGETVRTDTDRLLPFLSSESRLPELRSEQRVLAEHPSFPGCYAPGVILRLDSETGRAAVRFYDDVTCDVSWSRLQPVDAAACSALSETAAQFDSSWLAESVVCRREHSGVFYSGRVVGKSWKTRHYMVQYPDGAIEEQSIVHIFRTPGEESGGVEGTFVLASPDTGLFMPGEVRERREGAALVKFCHGEEKEIPTKELIVISKMYYENMFLFISGLLHED